MKLIDTAQKFGGSSMGSAERVNQAADLVEDALQEGNVGVVVSATRPVDGPREDGATDRLIALGAARARGEKTDDRLDALLDMHAQLATELDVQWREDHYRARIGRTLDRISGQEVTPAINDRLQTFGEAMMGDQFAQALRQRGVDAEMVDPRELIATDGRHGDATADMHATKLRAQERLNRRLSGGSDKVVVVPGFYGSDLERADVPTAFSRGGSDYSGAIVGAALGAGRVDICTDVDGVQRADPRRYPDAPYINQLSYRELLNLALGGASVVHPKAIDPVMNGGDPRHTIPMRVVNTANGESRTTISHEETPGAKAVASITGVTVVRVFDPGMIDHSGYVNRITQAFASAGISIDIIGTDNAAVTLTVDDCEVPRSVIRQLESVFRSVEVFPQHGAVALIGSQLGKTRGLLRQLYTAADDFDVELDSMGTQNSRTLVVPDEQVQPLEKCIYESMLKS